MKGIFARIPIKTIFLFLDGWFCFVALLPEESAVQGNLAAGVGADGAVVMPQKQCGMFVDAANGRLPARLPTEIGNPLSG